MSFQVKLAARYIWGRKLRAFLTTLAIVFGVLIVFGMNTLIPSMLASFQANLLAASEQVDVTVTHKTGESFNQSTLNKVRAVSGVRAAASSLSRTVNVPAGFFGRAVKVDVLNLVGVEPRAALQVRNYTVTSGRFLRGEEREAAVITTSLAEQLSLEVGDEMRMPTTVGVVKLTIVGLRTARATPGNEEVLVTLPEAQRLLDAPNRINVIDANLSTTDPAQRAAIEAALKDRLGSDFHLGTLGTGSEMLSSIEMARAIFSLMGVLALFMGGFIIFNTFRTVVAERRHDIGMLRAIGASRVTIVGILLAEGMLQGVVGTAIGLALGYLVGTLVLVGMGAVFEQALHLQMGGPVIEPPLVVISILLGIGTTILAGLFPALSAGRVTPIEALRPSVASVERRKAGWGTRVGAFLLVVAVLSLLSGNLSLVLLGGLFCLVGMVMVAPALVRPLAGVMGKAGQLMSADSTAKLAEGNISRQPSRAAVTASTMMIGLAIVVAATGLVTSMTGGIQELTKRTLGSDYLLIPPSIGLWGSNIGASSDMAERLREVRGVAEVSTLRFAASSLSGAARGDTAVSVLGIDPVAFPRISGLNFSQGNAEQAYRALGEGRGIIVNGILASQEGIGQGDSLSLSTPTGVHPYTVVAVASDFMNAKISTVYVSQATLKSDFRRTEDVFVQLNLASGADRKAVEAELEAIVADYPQFRLQSGQTYLEEMSHMLDMAFAGMYVMLIVLVFPSLVAILNTLAIGVIERTREIGMLRAVGATRDQIGRTIVLEAVLLAAIGVAFGLLGGLYLGYIMVFGLNSTGIFPLTYSFPLAGMFAAIAVGLIFGVIAALVPARQAARLEIITALRHE